MGSRANLALCALMLCVISTHSRAQQKYNGAIPWGAKGFHELSAWGGAGYSRLNASLATASVAGYAGGNLGAGYSYVFNNRRWSVHAGLEFSLLGSSTKAYTFEQSSEWIDSEGMIFTMHYRYNRYREYQHARYLNLPIGVGYTYKKFYAIAGVKPGLHLQSSYVSKINPLETHGDYPQFIGNFEDMPNHYFLSAAQEKKGAIKFGTNIVASLEAGINLAQRKQKNVWRLALFCDYGLNNIQRGTSSKSLIKYLSKPLDIHYNSFIYSELNNKNRVTSLMVGVKITRLLVSKPINRRYMCNCDPNFLYELEQVVANPL